MNKNILIISNHLHYFNMGGVEEYARNLILTLRDKYNVYEFGISILGKNETNKCIPDDNICSVSNQTIFLINEAYSFRANSLFKKIKKLIMLRKINISIKKQLNNFIEEKKELGVTFDLYIFNTKDIVLKGIDYNKAIFCQHNDNRYFNSNISIKTKLIQFFINRTTKNIWKEAKYTSTMNIDGLFYNKDISNILKTFSFINEKKSHLPFYKSKDICFVGRPIKEKGIYQIDEFAKKYKINIDVFGPQTKEIEDCKSINYKNQITPENASIIFSNYKLCILFSDEEGLSLVLANSLRNGTPIITRKNGWYNEKLLNENNDLRFDILDENAYKQIRNILDNCIIWEEYSKKAYDLYDSLFKNFDFSTDWNNFVEKILNENKLEG